jgi:hypothetical protein
MTVSVQDLVPVTQCSLRAITVGFKILRHVKGKISTPKWTQWQEKVSNFSADAASFLVSVRTWYRHGTLLSSPACSRSAAHGGRSWCLGGARSSPPLLGTPKRVFVFVRNTEESERIFTRCETRPRLHLAADGTRRNATSMLARGAFSVDPWVKLGGQGYEGKENVWSIDSSRIGERVRGRGRRRRLIEGTGVWSGIGGCYIERPGQWWTGESATIAVMS